ncbi:MAG: hypothetical protein JSR33_11995 [Proteobacteria bacterium]|nr:hypothetical protein [Pseudomonadota bacterium]
MSDLLDSIKTPIGKFWAYEQYFQIKSDFVASSKKINIILNKHKEILELNIFIMKCQKELDQIKTKPKVFLFFSSPSISSLSNKINIAKILLYSLKSKTLREIGPHDIDVLKKEPTLKRIVEALRATDRLPQNFVEAYDQYKRLEFNRSPSAIRTMLQ